MQNVQLFKNMCCQSCSNLRCFARDTHTLTHKLNCRTNVLATILIIIVSSMNLYSTLRIMHSPVKFSKVRSCICQKSLIKVYQHQSSLTMYTVDNETKTSKLQTKFLYAKSLSDLVIKTQIFINMTKTNLIDFAIKILLIH